MPWTLQPSRSIDGVGQVCAASSGRDVTPDCVTLWALVYGIPRQFELSRSQYLQAGNPSEFAFCARPSSKLQTCLLPEYLAVFYVLRLECPLDV